MYKILLIENVKQKNVINELHKIIKELNEEINYQNIRIKSLLPTHDYLMENEEKIIYSTNKNLNNVFELEKEFTEVEELVELINEEIKEVEKIEDVQEVEKLKMLKKLKKLKILKKLKKLKMLKKLRKLKIIKKIIWTI